MEVLDPEVVGEATIFGFGPLLTLRWATRHRARILGLSDPARKARSFP